MHLATGAGLDPITGQALHGAPAVCSHAQVVVALASARPAVLDYAVAAAKGVVSVQSSTRPMPRRRLNLLLGMNLDEGAAGVRLRNQLPFLFKPLQVKSDSLPDELQHFFAAFAGSDAAGKIRNIGAETGWAFFYNNEITHMST